MTTQSPTNAQIADYLSQMCRELAGMAKKARLPLAFDLLTLVAIYAKQHSPTFEKPKAKSART